MPGLLPTFEPGPLTFSAHVNILGGQLVMPAPNGRIQPTTGAVATCLGVAMGDAAAYTYAPTDSTDPWGNSIANMNPFPPNETAVDYRRVYVLKCTDAVAFGELVVSAANGECNPLGANTFDKVIGRCVEPGGIAAGARGKIKLGGVG